MASLPFMLHLVRQVCSNKAEQITSPPTAPQISERGGQVIDVADPAAAERSAAALEALLSDEERLKNLKEASGQHKNCTTHIPLQPVE
eukprot:1150050-Pelagomonas_calceolata.AAC.9